MGRFRLTTQAKVFVSCVAIGTGALVLWLDPSLLGKVAPKADVKPSAVPPTAALPGEGPTLTSGDFPSVDAHAPPCTSGTEVRFYHWAWNAQMGLMLANGGKDATADSAMCRAGVRLRLVREDNTDQMQALLLKFAESHRRGEAQPKDGAHFVAIMGDGSATFLTGLNDRLAKLGPDYVAVVVGSAGYSRGEDKFMGPPAWREHPESARGGLVAGVLRDGDWNIALKWLGDNKIKNNPSETTWDPDALNWVGASDYVDAAQKYVSGTCVDLKNAKTGKVEKHCVDGVVTWTPGDVTVAEKKGGLVSIVSTEEYRSQMPNVIIGHKKWMRENRDVVRGMLGAIFESGDQVKKDDAALRKAAAISAVVYGEKDAAYWYRYFKPTEQKDKQGLTVELGGSAVNNLADNRELFGLTPGAANAFAATYTVFGNVVRSQYPDLLPSFAPANQIVDLSYLEELSKTTTAMASEPDLPKFHAAQKIEHVVSKKAWQIQFDTGRASFTPDAEKELARLLEDLVVASGTIVEVHGHTDGAGNADANMRLSEERAFAVKRWLESHAANTFPEGRVRVFAHGQTEPVAPNTSEENRAKNRRVVIVLGTSNS